MKTSNIELKIDELVLHGFSPGDRYRIADVVERELAQMIAEREFSLSLTDSSEIDHLDGGTFEISQNSGPEATGKQVAAAVYRGLKKE